ncbi:MAG TPA: TPM domain-containing protein [Cyclobacteriaceae bacterium]|nr:TPM domain-containing protein [Cyclobacteriaceae bacterium]
MSLNNRFTAEDLERIKSAVRKAEEKISGEIVPVFVERSGYYTIANYRGAMIAAALVFLAIIVVDRYVPDLAVYDPLFIFITVVLAGLLGAIATHGIEPLKRVMLSQTHMDQATRKRAENAFLEEEVFNTRHRTGIMIFISFFEREVIVMADRGISKVVDQKEWDKLVRNIIDHIRMGKVTEGMEDSIIRCGNILLEKGFIKTPDDINELRDDLRIEN